MMKILLLEDNPEDVKMIKRHLKSSFVFDLLHVTNELEFRKEIEDFHPDIILSDYYLPRFSGEKALAIRNEKQILTPFIIVSNSINEEKATHLIKQGASDYVSKTHLQRLPSAITHALDGSASQRKNWEEEKENELKLKESEMMFRSLVEHSPNGIIIAKPEGKIVYANDAVVKMTGYSKQELLKMTGFESLMPPEEAKRCRQQMIKQTEKETLSTTSECTLLTKDNKNKIAEFYLSTTIWNGENLPMILLHDLTEQRKAEVELRMLNQAVEQSPVSIVITDTDGKIEYVNKYFTKITQYSSEEAIGENPRILQSGKTPKELYVNLWNSITNGEAWEGEFINRKKNGEEYIERAIINPVLNSVGKIVRFIALKEDITIKKEYEKKLIEAKEKAEEADRLKTNFLANISHELRTPMNGILGFSDLIEMEDSMETMKDMAGYIKASSLRLLNTLNLIIDYSITDASKTKMTITSIDVIKLLNQIVKNYSSFSKDKGIFLHFEPEEKSLILQCDGSILEKALTNLIDNAIKYTKKGGVSIGLERTDDNKIEIHIRDTGIGIAPEHQKIIFEPFRQVSEGYGRSFEGMGLGLSVTKRYIDVLGGEISLKSQKEKGSDFQIRLPIDASDTH